MSGLPSPVAARKSALVAVTKPRQRAERPSASRCCGARCWWNGWRPVFPVVPTGSGQFARWAMELPRAKCTACRTSFTVYPSGIYPRRQYQLDVVAQVVAGGALGGQAPVAAAAVASASATSARRWTWWLAALAPPADLAALNARLDPDAPAGAGLPAEAKTVRARAGRVLGALEQVGLALVRAGVACVEHTGLGRLLGWQHRAHGDSYTLVDRLRLSPAMVPEPRARAP